MGDLEVCKAALVDLCKQFLACLKILRQNGFISEADYEKYSRIKIMFIKQMENDC